VRGFLDFLVREDGGRGRGPVAAPPAAPDPCPLLRPASRGNDGLSPRYPPDPLDSVARGEAVA
jgi:hypothetical protein